MTGNVAVVVGAGPGLGAALARRFAAGGLTVAVARRTVEPAAALAEEIGGKAYACDATRRDDVEALFEAVRGELGAPRLVAYNAGAYRPGEVLDIDVEDFAACWRVGCLGGFHVGQAAARLMVEAGGGTILFTGATASLRGGPGFANLAVGKFGLRALAQSMARELGPRDIHVAHLVIDGQIAADRPGYRSAERGEDRVLKPEAIAEAAWFLHGQQRSAWTHELDLRPFAEKW